LLEADFQHYYTMDLRVQVGVSGCRRLWALVRGLPVDAAVWRDGKHWTQRDELAAIGIERADIWGHRLTMASRAFKGRIPEMPQIEHPDRRSGVEVPSRPRMSSRAEIRAFAGKVGGA
jgi:hypothetical protein